MKRLIIATMVVATTVGTVYAMPRGGMPGGEGPGFGPRGGLIRALQQLDLSEAQKREVALIVERHREEGREKADALHEALEGLRGISEATPIDEDAIREAFGPVAAAGEEMAVHRARLIAELRQVLTPEQWETLKEQRGSGLERMKERRNRRSRVLDDWVKAYSQDGQDR
jgi:Spy/CpxP family protein refolding chaperone